MLGQAHGWRIDFDRTLFAATNGNAEKSQRNQSEMSDFIKRLMIGGERWNPVDYGDWSCSD